MSRLLKRKKILFNIHLILSIICAIPLIVVTVTGAIFSYAQEISDFINGKNLTVQKQDAQRLTPGEILAKFNEKTSSMPIMIQISGDENRAYKVYKTRIEVYLVNPYTGEIIASDKGEKFTRIVLSLHRNLGFSLIKTENKNLAAIGKNIVAVSTIILIILLITGVWLYMPMLKNKFIKSIRLNLKLKGFSLFYNIHCVIGIWTSLILLTACLTGLVWSYKWYDNMINWVFGVAQSTQNQGSVKRSDKYEFSEVDRVYNVFEINKIAQYERLYITLRKNNDEFNVSYNLKGASPTDRYKSMRINTKDGNVTFNSMKAEPSDRAKLRTTIYELHTGFIFGWVGRLLWCVASFGAAIIVISGFYMTFKRAFKRR